MKKCPICSLIMKRTEPAFYKDDPGYHCPAEAIHFVIKGYEDKIRNLDLLNRYLLLECEMVLQDSEGNWSIASRIREVLDPLWHKLSEEDRQKLEDTRLAVLLCDDNRTKAKEFMRLKKRIEKLEKGINHD